MSTDRPLSTTLPDDPRTLAAIAHLVDHSGLQHTVLFGFDGGRQVARTTVVESLLSDGQRVLWSALQWFANAPGELCAARSHPHVDAESGAAIDVALAMTFGWDASERAA